MGAGRVRRAVVAGLVALVLAVGLWQGLLAQEETTYTVQPGDTLAAIADRLGVEMEALAAANGIQDVNRIYVGQVLVIPGRELGLATVSARPGESLEALARRVGVEAVQLAALNGLSETARLFPGQPIRLPSGISPPSTRGFGAVVQVEVPEILVQGHTGRIALVARRPLSLAVTWNGLPVPVYPEPSPSSGLVYRGFLPVPALLAPGDYPVTVAYTATNGVPLARELSVRVVEGAYEAQRIMLPPDRSTLLDSQILADELARLRAAWSQADTPVQWREPFRMPMDAEYPTTSAFGTRRSYNGGPFASYHAGQDFAVPAGVTITAPADGIVALAEPLRVRGNAVMLDHGRGVFTGYWHLAEALVQAGQVVKAGDPIGVVGNTGLSTGAHLHWELRIYGIAVDPMQFVDEPLFPQEPGP